MVHVPGAATITLHYNTIELHNSLGFLYPQGEVKVQETPKKKCHNKVVYKAFFRWIAKSGHIQLDQEQVAEIS